ncbi:hypothetical protein, partial [Alkalicoccus daliensis]
SDLLEGHEARAESILVLQDSMAVSALLSVDRWKPCLREKLVENKPLVSLSESEAAVLLLFSGTFIFKVAIYQKAY